MKIAIVAHSINGMTGAGRIIAAQTEFLANKMQALNKKAELTVISNQIKHLDFVTNPLIKVRLTFLCFIHTKNRLLRFKKFANALIQTEKYDLVITHNQGSGDIAFIHNFFYLPPNSGQSELPKPLPKKSSNKTNSKIIVVPSELTKKLYLLKEGLNQDVRVLIPGIDIKKFNKELKRKKTELRRKYGISDNSENPPFVISLITSGQLENRGIEQFLEVIKRLSNAIENIVVIVVGNVTWYAKPKLNFYLKQALAPRVRFKYFNKIREIEEIYAVTDLMIFPSRNETFGMVVAEALACSVPVITNQNVGAHQILSDVPEFIMPSSDSIQEMSELALKLYQQQAYYAGIFEKLADKIVANYSWEKHLNDFYKIVEEVLIKKNNI
ncbi:MAG: glycosyltransferase family 4 protein [Deltaproteobacteria bacterium]|jgi:glycosyltransferase involved in cell wall biosynthesis|nr:glycosyltransferase family 4 protein [Deltaproteobacteria bacterium]